MAGEDEGFAATLERTRRPPSDAERDAVAKLREIVPPPADEPLSDADYLRFLRARGGDLPKAREFLEQHLAWRLEHQPARIGVESVHKVLVSGVCRLTGVTRERTAILWFRVDLWEPSGLSMEQWLQFIIFVIERTLSAAERFVAMFDMDGWRLSHAMHLGKIHGMIQTLQNHYPERLEASLLLRAPAIFDAAWSLIKPVIDPVTAAKVFFVRRADEARRLPTFVSPEVLPDSFGGGRQAAAQLPMPNLPGVTNLQPGQAGGGAAAASHAPHGAGSGDDAAVGADGAGVALGVDTVVANAAPAPAVSAG